MANITKLKHLEHLEDEMLNYGVEGCVAAVNFLNELAKMLGQKADATGFLQTKWDGAPSVVCGKHPGTGIFFVGTKSVFNITEPKMCSTEKAVDKWYSGDLAEKLKYSLRYFSKLGIDGIVQGDLLYTDTTRKTETVDGEKLYTFRPNTITYGIPLDHPIGKEVGQSKIGVVFHTHYVGDTMDECQAKAGAPIKDFKKVNDVAVISNDTPVNKVTLSEPEVRSFHTMIKSIEVLCGKCGEFLDNIVENVGTTGEKKWHVASYLKPFFNSKIKKGTQIGNVRSTLDELIAFYHEKTKKELAKIKTTATLTAKRQLVFGSEKYLDENEEKFKSMIQLYKEIQHAKQFIIDKLDTLEHWRTFVQTENGYKVTGPEGYVLHQNGDMIKLVNRIEFAFNNFTLQKQWR